MTMSVLRRNALLTGLVVVGVGAFLGDTIPAPGARPVPALQKGKGDAAKGKALTPKELEALWDQLTTKDPKVAYKVTWTLIEAPREAIPFLRKRVRPKAPVKAERLKKLLRDLSSKEEKVWKTAYKELLGLRELAVNGVRDFLRGKLPKEVQQRAEKLLNDIVTGPFLPPDRLRELRVLGILELMASRESCKCFRGWPGGRQGPCSPSKPRRR
jgi:hypothetical protein